MSRLGDVCSFFSGTGFPNIYQGQKTGKYPFYKVGDISKNVLLGNRELIYSDNYVDDGAVQAIKGTVLPPKTVVFAKIGEALRLNRRAMTNCYCLVDNNAMGILPDNTVLDSLYFYYFMCSVDLQHYCESTTVPSVRKTRIAEIEVPLLPLEEQRRIAALLDKVSGLIAKRRVQLDKLDLMVKARFVEITENSETVPTRMGDVATYINGYAFKPTDWSKNGLPIIRIQNLNNVNAEYNYFDDVLPEKYLVRKGDVLVSWATHLEAYIWKGNDAWLNQHIFKVVFDKMPISDVYFVYSTEEALRQAFRNAHGFKPTMEHIKRSDFENAVIQLPDVEVQNKFTKFVAQVDKAKLTIQQSLDKLETLKKSLMQQYFG